MHYAYIDSQLYSMIAQSVRSACVVLIMHSVVVIIMVQSVPDCAVMRSAFSETPSRVLL